MIVVQNPPFDLCRNLGNTDWRERAARARMEQRRRVARARQLKIKKRKKNLKKKKKKKTKFVQDKKRVINIKK